MPHQQNPVRAASAIAAAIRAPGLVATMLSAMPQEHERGLGGWQAEWETLPELIDVAHEAAQALAGALEALVVEPARMRTNLDRLGGLALAEAVVMQLAPVMGRKEASARVSHAARQAHDEGRAFADVLAGVPEIAAVMGPHDIEQALSPDRYLGASADFIASVLERHGKA
jgi:3-carboxy-cis,cis-muconate cycloisomerase